MTTKPDEVEDIRKLLKWVAERVITHRNSELTSVDECIETLLPPVIATLRKVYVNSMVEKNNG